MSHYPLDEPLRPIDTFCLGSPRFHLPLLDGVNTVDDPDISLLSCFLIIAYLLSMRIVPFGPSIIALFSCFSLVIALRFSYFIFASPQLTWGGMECGRMKLSLAILSRD